MIAHFALRLLFGMSMMWSIMPRRQVTAGFFRIQMLIALGLSVLAALTIGRLMPLMPEASAGEPMLSRGTGMTLCLALGIGAFLGSIVWTLERRRAGTCFVFLIAGTSAAVLLLSTSTPNSWRSAAGVFSLVSELSTASMLGGATTGMLLGHWYLTAPTMSIAPLSRLNLYFAVAVFVRLVLSTIGLWLVWDRLSGSTFAIWLLLRWLAGIFGPILVVVMVWRILKYKNTQAATGVLFVGVVLTFIGELMASLLQLELSMPM